MDPDHAPEVPPMYEVGITYCNDGNLSHPHSIEPTALQEYLNLAKLGFEDQEPDSFRRTHPDTKHVRMVSLIRRRGEDRHIFWHIDTGVIYCLHRPVSE